MSRGKMSPLLIRGANFDAKLSSTGANHEHTAGFMAKGTEPFELDTYTTPAGYVFRRSLDGKQIRLIHDGETAYYVKLHRSSHVIPGVEHVTQVGVWRSKEPKHRAAVNGLAAIVFAYLLKTYNVVVSDSEQTGAGAYFWSERITYAISLPNQHAYFWDGTKEDASPVEITDKDQFEAIWRDGAAGYHWGDNRDEHPHRLFIITGRPLTELTAGNEPLLIARN